MASGRDAYPTRSSPKCLRRFKRPMKVFLFSDIHEDFRAMERVLTVKADIYICAGDLATFGRGLGKCGEILAPLKETLWLLPGNHESHQQTRELCERFGFFDFHRQLRTIDSPNG